MPTGLFPKQPPPGAPGWQQWLYWGMVITLLLVFVIGLLWKSVKIIPRGHAGIKTRYGKARKRYHRKKGEACRVCDARAATCSTCVQGKYCRTCPRCELHDEWRSVGPGIYVVFPGTDNIVTTETQDRILELSAIAFDKAEDREREKQYIVDGTLTCAVNDDGYSLYEAIFEPKDLEDSLKALANVCLGRAASTAADLTDIDAIAAEAAQLYNGDGMTYGSVAKRFLVKPIPRSREQVLGEHMSPGSSSALAAAVTRGSLEVA